MFMAHHSAGVLVVDWSWMGMFVHIVTVATRTMIAIGRQMKGGNKRGFDGDGLV